MLRNRRWYVSPGRRSMHSRAYASLHACTTRPRKHASPASRWKKEQMTTGPPCSEREEVFLSRSLPSCNHLRASMCYDTFSEGKNFHTEDLSRHTQRFLSRPSILHGFVIVSGDSFSQTIKNRF